MRLSLIAIVCGWAVVGCTSAWGQVNVAELQARSEAAGQANEVLERQYAYREYKVQTEIGRDGKPVRRRTETWEGIGLEGSEYRQLVARDDQPLSAKEQKKEDERRRKEAETRRKANAQQKGSREPRSDSLWFTRENLHLFETVLVGEETVDGRAMYVLEGKPKADARPRDDNEKELLRLRFRSWVDRETFFEAGLRMEFSGRGRVLQGGSVIETKNRRLDDGTWVLDELRIHYVTKGETGDQVTTRSDYQRFTVDSRVVEP